jgi:hypothetical protein
MTKDEALKLALEALETPWNAPYVDGCDLALGKKVKAITAIKEALAQPEQEPCCYGGIAHDCHAGEGCRIVNRMKATQPQRTWEKFCDSNCVWTDHHPDCKLAQPEHGWTPERIAGMARLKEAQDKKLAQLEPVAWEQFYPEMGSPKLAYLSPTKSLDNACYIPPQRKPLSDEEILTYRHMIDWTAEWSYINFARAIEVAHGIKGEA